MSQRCYGDRCDKAGNGDCRAACSNDILLKHTMITNRTVIKRCLLVILYEESIVKVLAVSLKVSCKQGQSTAMVGCKSVNCSPVVSQCLSSGVCLYMTRSIVCFAKITSACRVVFTQILMFSLGNFF